MYDIHNKNASKFGYNYFSIYHWLLSLSVNAAVWVCAPAHACVYFVWIEWHSFLFLPCFLGKGPILWYSYRKASRIWEGHGDLHQEKGTLETCILSFDLSLFYCTCFLKFDISLQLFLSISACYNQSLIYCRNPVSSQRNLMMSTVTWIGREQIKQCTWRAIWCILELWDYPLLMDVSIVIILYDGLFNWNLCLCSIGRTLDELRLVIDWWCLLIVHEPWLIEDFASYQKIFTNQTLRSYITKVTIVMFFHFEMGLPIFTKFLVSYVG